MLLRRGSSIISLPNIKGRVERLQKLPYPAKYFSVNIDKNNDANMDCNATTRVQINKLLLSAVSSFISQKGVDAATLALGEKSIYATPTVGRNTEQGDYQTNAALLLAKPLKMKPQDLAKALAAIVQGQGQTAGLLDEVSVSGPGFVNFKVSKSHLWKKITRAANDRDRVGIDSQSIMKRRVVVDYSSPNIAKDMHVVSDCTSISGRIFRILIILLCLFSFLGSFEVHNYWGQY